MKTCYTPFRNGNLYCYNIKKCLNDNNIEVYSIRKVFTNPVLFYQCKVFNFNWFERVEHFYQFIYKVILILILKLFRKKIIYTVHNKKPHDMKNDFLSVAMMKILCKSSSKIIGMCNDTKEIIKGLHYKHLEKLIIIPHPNYITNYPCLMNKEPCNQQNLSFLFFGNILPYKNLEILIDLFNEMSSEKIELHIVGSISDELYAESLKARIKYDNIKCDFRFVSDENIAEIFSGCDAVILPYSMNSSLNSGTVMLSFSLKKVVICPTIGTINDISDNTFIYRYSYSNSENHMHKLKSILNTIIKNETQSSLAEKGLKAYEYVRDNNSLDVIGKQYKEIYEAL